MIAKLSVQWKVAESPRAFGGICIVSLGYFSVEFGGAALVAATRSDLASAVSASCAVTAAGNAIAHVIDISAILSRFDTPTLSC